MAKIKVKLENWLQYLEEQVNKTIYVWGANDELLVNLLPKLVNMEKSDHTETAALNDVDRVLTLLQKRLLQGCDMLKIRCADCSGLSIRFLLENEIIKSDMTANGLWEYIVGNPEKGIKAHGKKISLKSVKAGDYLFDGTDNNKWHVGYAISNTYAIESQNRDVGVVKTKISERSWKYAARPDWYEGETPTPIPVVPTLTRELYLTDPYMKGDDVREVQEALNERGFNCGTADGVFGKKTSIAVRNFQSDNGLTVDGIVGKKTALALGFAWEG